ncbi:MAG TPA: helix-turn-helix domain-containing protein [Candidatus Nanoarchaeia archaeon]|nr:helix-turn-helix domain-containing protein [Candidatus Nanoarchaeia archaeon]
MPYKHEYSEPKQKITETYDRRRKLTDKQREEIKELYGKISQRKLAKKYGVSRRTIIWIGCPEKYKKNLEDRAKRGGSKIYYDCEKHKKAMKKHRKHKHELDKNNKLVEKMCEVKQKCPLCKEWFVSNNGNRKYCFNCSPKPKNARE